MGGQEGNTAMDVLKAQQDRQKIADTMAQSFQKIGANVAQPMALPQMGQQQNYAQALGQQQMQAGAGQSPLVAQLGQLFPQGGGGINEQQLAMILQRLGYGG